MQIPDEGVIALGATLVTLAAIGPLLVKWWPKSEPRRSGGRGSASRAAKVSTPAAERPAAVARRPALADRAAAARPSGAASAPRQKQAARASRPSGASR